MKRLMGKEAGIRPASATTATIVGISHEDMAELLGITLDEWLAPADDIEIEDDDAVDWEH